MRAVFFASMAVLVASAGNMAVAQPSSQPPPMYPAQPASNYAPLKSGQPSGGAPAPADPGAATAPSLCNSLHDDTALPVDGCQLCCPAEAPCGPPGRFW